MPELSGNVFSLSAEGGTAKNWAQADAMLALRGDLAASLHRGLDLGASAQITGVLKGAFAKFVAADLDAGVDAWVGASIKAEFPLDLFTGAGVIAQAEAVAEAAAWVKLDVGLAIGDFKRLLVAELGNTVWLRLADAVLDQLTVRAGIWAAASFAAEAYAKAGFVGCLMGEDPGFTASFDYGAGYGEGQGWGYCVNVGLQQPSVLLDRLGDVVVDAVLEKLDAEIAHLPGVKPDDARAAAAYLRILLPAAARGGFETAAILANDTPADPQGVARDTIATAFLREAQTLLLDLIAEAGGTKLSQLLGGVVAGFKGLTPAQITSIKTALQVVASVATKMAVSGAPSIDDIEALAALVDPLLALVEVGAIGSADVDEWRRTLADVWCAVQLAERLVPWITSTFDRSQNYPRWGEAVAVSTDSQAAQIVATRLGIGAGRALTMVDLFSYLAKDAADLVKRVAMLSPAIHDLLVWLGNVLGGTTLDIVNDSVAAAGLFSMVLDPTSSASAWGDILTRLEASAASLINQKIIPDLLAPLEARLQTTGDAAGLELLRRVVRPTLFSLVNVLFTDIPKLQDASYAPQFRERVSAVILQFLSKTLLAINKVLLDEATRRAHDVLAQLAADVDGGRRDDVFARVLVAAERSPLPIVVDRPTVKTVLLGVQAVIDASRTAGLVGAVTDALSDVVNLGLTTGEPSLDDVWSTLAASPDALPSPLLPRLTTFVLQMATVLAKVAETVALTEFQLLADLVKNNPVVRWLEQEVDAGIDAGKRALAAAGTAIDQLIKDLAAVRQAIDAAVIDIDNHVHTITAAIAGAATQAIARLHDRGWDLVVALHLDGVPGVHQLYDAAFAALRDVTVAVQGLIDGAADAMAAAVLQVLDAVPPRPTVPTDLLASFERRLLAAEAQPVTLSLSVLGETFSVTFSAQDLASAVTKEVLALLQPASAFVSRLVALVNGQVANLLTRDAKATLLQSTQQQDQRFDDDLSTVVAAQAQARPLAVRIAPGVRVDGGVQVHVEVDGASPDFLATMAGVTPRLVLYVNTEPVSLSPSAWGLTPTGIAFDGVLMLHATQRSRLPIPMPAWDYHFLLRVPVDTHIALQFPPGRWPEFSVLTAQESGPDMGRLALAGGRLGLPVARLRGASVLLALTESERAATARPMMLVPAPERGTGNRGIGGSGEVGAVHAVPDAGAGGGGAGGAGGGGGGGAAAKMATFTFAVPSGVGSASASGASYGMTSAYGTPLGGRSGLNSIYVVVSNGAGNPVSAERRFWL